MKRIFDHTVKRLYASARTGLIGYLERRNGIETNVEIQLEELGLAGEGRNRYKPAGWRTLRRILPPREVGPEDVFIDVGSGMGRAVFLAARNYRFKRVIGVELSEVLNGVARANIDRNRERLRCPDIELFTTDVLDYEVPDDVTVAFFNNPFVGAVFTVAIDKLLASVDRRPRRVRLIYCNPIEHDQLMSRERFRPVRKLSGLRPGRDWSRSNATQMYDVLPRPAGTREARRSPYNTG